MNKRIVIIAAALLLLPASPRAESTIAMTSFGGITNLPFWVAQDKGYFKAQGLTVAFAQTRSSIVTDQLETDGIARTMVRQEPIGQTGSDDPTVYNRRVDIILQR